MYLLKFFWVNFTSGLHGTSPKWYICKLKMYVINIPVSQHKYPTIKVQWLVDRNIACRKNVVFQSVFGPEMYICRNSLYGGGALDKDCCLLWDNTAGVNILPFKPIKIP